MKKTIISTLAFSLIGFSSLLGADYSMEKSFKTPVEKATVMSAVVNAGKTCDWQITSKQDANGKLTLSKSFAEKSQYFNHPAYRGKRTITHHNVSVDVIVTDNGMKISSTDLPQNSKLQSQIKNDIEMLNAKMHSKLMLALL